MVEERLVEGDSAGQSVAEPGAAGSIDENFDSGRLSVLSVALAAGGRMGAAITFSAVGALATVAFVGLIVGLIVAGVVEGVAEAATEGAVADCLAAAASCTALPAAAMKLAGESGQSNDVSTRSSWSITQADGR